MATAAIGRGLRDNFDWPLFVTVAGIAVIGVTNLYSATSAASEALSELYIQQIYWLTFGAGVAVLIVAIDYRHFERFGWVAYGAGIVMLVLVFLLAPEIRGSQRWIRIGSFSLQPSETMKVVLIVALAKYLHNDPKTEGRTLKDLVVPAAILAAPMILVLKQPDLGTALILAFIFGSIMLLTKLKLRSLLVLVVAFVLSAPLTWTYLLEEYQKERFLSFWDQTFGDNPDILDSGWHAFQSKVAIGSGGMWGKGFMQGTQNQHRFLPDQQTDFPFAVWSEEHGFAGVLLLFFLYVFLILWGLKVASQAKDRFGAVVAVGVSAFFFWHTVINIGMVSGLLPVVGVTLPLFSYGGSSVLTSMMAIGLLMNVSIRRFSF
ncbi:MAG: rod shape-determining protein RodA [Sandaracinaceae bacterium]|nr:rod shape-determining protein RodA [Sandaracinaceae bacterium]MCC6874532.1 rod shape-determining protein RodA [Sandaracinaceae bacterium]